MIEQLHHGFCTRCDGPVEHAVCPITDASSWSEEDEETEDSPFGSPEETPIVQHDCRQCAHKATTGLQYSLLTHPAVVEFYYDHGVDIRDRSIWEFTIVGLGRERVQNTDPFRASTVFTVDDDELTVVVDDAMCVVKTTVDEAT